MHRWDGGQDFSMVITIFLAVNYCDVYNNKGAVLKIKVFQIIKWWNNDLNKQQYNLQFTSLLTSKFYGYLHMVNCFYCKKVTEVLFQIIQPRDGDAIDEIIDEEDFAKFKELVGGQQQKNNNVFLKMMQIQKGLRQQSESLFKTKEHVLIIEFLKLFQIIQRIGIIFFLDIISILVLYKQLKWLIRQMKKDLDLINDCLLLSR